MRIFQPILLFFIVASGLTASFAQTYAPFTITAYDSSSTGYYFICPFKLGANPGGIVPTHMILDSTGNVVYYKRFLAGQNTGDFKLHDNGLMSFSFQGKIYIMDSTFMVIDSLFCKNGILTDSHDMQMLPNGNFLLLGYTYETMDLSGYYLFGLNNLPGSATANVICSVIQEQDAMKNVVFEWHAKDHFAFDDVDEAWLNNPNVVDWTHCNAVELDLDGNILLSIRHFNEITKINRLTGAVIWRFGGNVNMFNFLNDPMHFKRQHDVRRLSNGNLTLFDNGDGSHSNPFHFASGKEYLLDESAMTAELVWDFTDDVNQYSQSMGNFQRRPGGNSVLSYGFTANENKLFSVVNDAGQKVFEMAFVDTLRAYRSFNYPSLPWSLQRPQLDCYEISGQYYLDAGPGHASYLWSNGAATQVIPVTATGNYSVFVPKGQGGFISSEIFVVSDMTDPCNLTGLHESVNSQLVISPNPVTDFVDINFGTGTGMIQFYISNTSGQVTISGAIPLSGQLKLATSHWQAGIYYLRTGSVIRKIVKY